MNQPTEPAEPDPPVESVQAADARYNAALHAMQSGVAFEVEAGMMHETEPKHLRVGVNSAHVSILAISRLLLAKGVVTEEELHSAVADAMDDEVDSYEEAIRDHLGQAVTLR